MGKEKTVLICLFLIWLIVNSLFYIVDLYSQKSKSIIKLTSGEKIIFSYPDLQIKMNCFLACDPANLACMDRHTGGRYNGVIFKGDDIACDLHYLDKENINVKNFKIEILFVKYGSELEKNTLNLKLEKEQFFYRLKEKGMHTFVLNYLPNEESGWGISILDVQIYAYDSIEDYEYRLIDYHQKLGIFCFSAIGIIITFFASILCNRKEIKVNSEKYTMRIWKKGKRKNKNTARVRGNIPQRRIK